MINKIKIFFQVFSLEGFLWLAGLIILIMINTDSAHFTVCPFNNLGLDFCPGCGLGRSINYFVRLDFENSFSVHPLGGVAFFIILYRIFLIIKNNIQNSNKTFLLRS
ncbi:MAG TPA: DUF2752 domain-containing protein [Ignavibacteriaceae bacterium]|nr:DUF2752 domain-containing protein [Ignavibacteriaceae bacterium]